MAEISAVTAQITNGEPISAASIEDMNPMVRALAGKILARLPRGSGIEMADLIQAGNVGLLQAARTFSAERGAPLAGYAKFRIRGEMLDTVRRNAGPWRGCFTREAEAPDDDMDLESRISAPSEHSPHSLVTRSQRADILGQEVERLPPRYQTVVRLRYTGDFTLREIGAVLCVRESRACQLHRSALGYLRRALSKRGVRRLSNLM
jgi:RNA polymerase sigma factor for flagellar operon FliA